MGDVVDILEYRNRYCNICKYKVKDGCNGNSTLRDFELWCKGKKPTCFVKRREWDK